MTPTLREAAETAWAYVEGPSTEFDRRPELVLRHVPTPQPLLGMAARARLDDVAAALGHARAWFAARGRSELRGSSAATRAPATSPHSCSSSARGPTKRIRSTAAWCWSASPRRWTASTCVRLAPSPTTSRRSFGIDERLGFETVCELQALVDTAAPA